MSYLGTYKHVRLAKYTWQIVEIRLRTGGQFNNLSSLFPFLQSVTGSLLNNSTIGMTPICVSKEKKTIYQCRSSHLDRTERKNLGHSHEAIVDGGGLVPLSEIQIDTLDKKTTPLRS